MMKHEYQDLMENIEVPEALNHRVLSAARGKRFAVKKTRRPLWRAAACAACALLLVLGSVMPKPQSEIPEADETGALVCGFGLTAYAADNRSAANGNLVLGGRETPVIQPTVLRPEEMQFTEFRFRVQGLNIEKLTLSMDRGGLYRLKNGGQTGDILPRPAVEDYDPETVYGLWVPPREFEQGKGFSLLDGALLTVTAHFINGSEQTNTYRITKQRLLVSRNQDGTEVLVPALVGSGQDGVSGLYLESLSSVWLQWPVEGSNTVSLSNRYGYRAAPGGQDGAFHAGIDIPGEQGMSITAAAAGTVLETGFDPVRGNYLLLDHGDGLTTLYGQCREVLVLEGDAVEAGEEIALLGSTGMSTGPHLHFEVRQDGEAQNPMAYFDSAIRDTLSMG